MENELIEKVVTKLVHSHIIDVEIIGQVIKELLPKSVSKDIFRMTNLAMRNENIRQIAFNKFQMRSNGYSRIN